MSLATNVFFAIDYFFDPFQNPKKKTEQNKEKVACAHNIVYNEEYPDACLLDTYVVPRKDGSKYPVIIEIHGGGFVAGDKKYRACLSAWFAVHTGAFVMNLNYGLAPKYSFPYPVKQLAAVFDWIYANAEELNLDLDNIAVTGDSAGGYYSSYLAALSSNEKLQEYFEITPKVNIKAAVLNCGLYDIKKALENKNIRLIADSICFSFAGIKLKNLEDYEYLDVMSPIDYLTPAFPSSYVIYAKKDIFCKGQGEELLKRLEEDGVKTERFASTSVFDNHTFSLTWRSKAAKKANMKILTFLNAEFYGEDVPDFSKYYSDFLADEGGVKTDTSPEEEKPE